MPNYTSNYNLTKPLPNELYNLDIQNNNMDNVDTNLKKVSDVADEANSRSKTNESNLEALKTFQEDPFEETGSVVQVDLFQDAPLKCLTHIEPVQAGSGDPSPVNVRPISGFTGAKLTKCGKNLLKLDSSASGIQGGVTFTANPDGTVTLSGTATSDIYRAIASNVNLVNGEYILNGCPTGAVDSNYILYWAPAISSNKIDSGHGVWFTVDNQETYKVMVRIMKGTNTTGLVFKPMIRLATEIDASYTPYQGDTFSANFGQTVYGGTLNWNTGVLTVEYASRNNMSVSNIGTNTDGRKYCSVLLPDCVDTKSDVSADIISSFFKVESVPSYKPWTGYHINTVAVFFTNDNSTVEEVNDILANQTIVYKLAAPFTVQFTPQEISALAGCNTLYSNSGGTTVSGRKDIIWLTHSLIKRIEALEAQVAGL